MGSSFFDQTTGNGHLNHTALHGIDESFFVAQLVVGEDLHGKFAVGLFFEVVLKEQQRLVYGMAFPDNTWRP